MSESDSNSASRAAVPIRRGNIALNVLVQLLAVLLLVGVANYVAWGYYKRWDLTKQKEYTLSSQTANYLGHLKETKGKSEIIALFPRGSDEDKDIRSLLEEYRRIAKSRLDIEHIDPELQNSRVVELERRYRMPLNRNGIIISREAPKKSTEAKEHGGRRTRFLGLEDLFAYEASNKQGQPPRVSYFLGESAITSALMNVTDSEPPLVCVLAHNVRARTVPTDGSTFFQTLEMLASRQNIRLETLNMTAGETIPPECKAIVSIYPGFDFTEREMEKLKEFWSKKRAALLFMLNPEFPLPRLNKFLNEHGVAPRGDRVLVAEKAGDKPFKQLDVVAEFIAGSPITNTFGGSTIQMMEKTQSLALVEDEEQQKTLMVEVKPLLKASKPYWGESRWEEVLPGLDDQDTPSPVFVAASVERGAMREKDPSLRLESNRMVIVGNSSLLDPDLVTATGADFVTSSLNWMLNRDERMGIAARKKDVYRIDLPPSRTQEILWLCLGVLPAAVLMFALFMWSARRA